MRRSRRQELREYIKVAARALGREVLLSAPARPFESRSTSTNGLAKLLSLPTGSALEERIELVRRLLFATARTYHLVVPTLFVKFSKLESHEAGHISAREGKWYIEIDEAHCWDDQSLSAIAAHEIAHIVLALRGISLQPVVRNEELTDTVAVLGGFGPHMCIACDQHRIGILPLFVGVVSVEHRRIGYLDRPELEFILQIKACIASGQPLKRLASIYLRKNLYIPCYGCATHLRGNSKEGRFIVRCPVCELRQEVTLKAWTGMTGARYLWKYVIHIFYTVLDRLRGFERVGVSLREEAPNDVGESGHLHD